MRGREVIAARERLGLTRAQLAALFSVNSTTVLRWERGTANRMDPLHRQLFLQLLAVSSHSLAVAYGKALREAIAENPAYALHVLLAMAFHEWTPSGAN